ncbi:hypothetical protein [Cupriavidus yeoncheonensis]|nr:hypothetical protein [Cupriavidus yeoncheonensis]
MQYKLLATAIAIAALSACGGGGDSASSPSPSPSTSVTPTTVIKGTAAVGAALPNATVQAKCAVGSGTATTAADGTFTLNIQGATRPCVLSVATPDGQTLHSVLESGTGTSAVANITPLTELVTASIAGGSTSDFFSNFDATAQGKLTSAGVSAGTANVVLVLSGTVDLTGIDPLKDTLVAAHGDTPGNALDQRLDTLGTALASSKTSISDLSEAVASNKGSTDGIKTLLNPASATCATYRSGKYQKVDLTANTIQRFTVDAVALTRTNDATSASEQFQAYASEACRFGNTDARLLVSKSGIGLERRAGAPSLLIPEQTIPLSELAGDWVAMSFERETNPGNYGSGLIQFNVDGAGKFTKAADCGMSGCGQPWPAGDLPTFSANANGGFDLTDTSGTARAFGFKGVDGQLAVVIVHANGFMVARHPVARVLPEVGFTNAYWDASLNDMGVTDITTFSNTVTAVNTTAHTYTRQRNDGRIDTWYDNVPFTGIRYRPAVAPVNGIPGAGEAISMNLSNTGLTISINASGKPFYSISIDRP